MSTTTRWQTTRAVGWALRRSASAQKITARVLGLTDSQLSKQIHGVRTSTAAEFYADIRRLVAHEKTEAGHLIAGALAEAVDEATGLGEGEIRARLYHALQAETDAQAAEDRAEHRVMVALGRTETPFASPDDWTELRDALEAHDEATLDETAWHVTALLYNRALRKARGWRK